MNMGKLMDTDLLFAGGGLSGLSLAWHIETAMPGRYRMIIVDREARVGDDRTWCFWEKGEGPFQAAVIKQWDRLKVLGPDWERILDIPPYAYRMIRSSAFYALVREGLAAAPGIQFLTADILGLESEKDSAVLRSSIGNLRGRWLFNSALRPDSPARRTRTLLQHFKGYFLTMPRSTFDPDVPHFMDFRVEQGKDVRFVYVLPITETRALAEFTVFSPRVWEQQEYHNTLQDYLGNILGIKDYVVDEEEFGVIPMTDHPHPLRTGRRILNLGTAGGRTKASTGFTFVNVQRHSAAVALSLQSKGHPFARMPLCHKRYSLYDAILLDVLTRNLYPGRDIFSHMFLRNAPVTVFDFLGEQSRFHQELQLFASFPQGPFVRAFLRVARHRLGL